MVCKRCGKTLPMSGFTCSNCGCMMNSEQIKEQKEDMKLNMPSNTEYITEKYGKKIIYEKRNEEKKKGWGVLLFVFLICLLVVLGIFVYLF